VEWNGPSEGTPFVIIGEEVHDDRVESQERKGMRKG